MLHTSAFSGRGTCLVWAANSYSLNWYLKTNVRDCVRTFIRVKPLVNICSREMGIERLNFWWSMRNFTIELCGTIWRAKVANLCRFDCCRYVLPDWYPLYDDYELTFESYRYRRKYIPIQKFCPPGRFS